MLKYYKPIIKCWLNKKEFDISYLCADEISGDIPKAISKNGGWDEICNFSDKFLYRQLPWKITATRRGLKIEILEDLGFTDNDIKQWKTILEFKFEVNWVECSPSINKLLNYHNGEIAIQYMVERGLKVINKGEV